MKKILSILLCACLVNLLPQESKAMNKDESGSILTALICAVLGCKIPERRNNSSKDSSAHDPKPNKPAADAKPYVQPRRADQTQLEFLNLRGHSDFFKYLALGDTDVFRIPSLVVWKLLNNKSKETTASWVGKIGSYTVDMNTGKQAFRDYRAKGLFTLLKIGTDNNGQSLCIQYRYQMAIQPIDERKPPIAELDHSAVACDEMLLYSHLEDTTSQTIDWNWSAAD